MKKRTGLLEMGK